MRAVVAAETNWLINLPSDAVHDGPYVVKTEVYAMSDGLRSISAGIRVVGVVGGVEVSPKGLS